MYATKTENYVKPNTKIDKKTKQIALGA